MTQTNCISCEDLLNNKKDNLLLLDVREKRELQNGTIENALNIPLNTLNNNLHLLPKIKKLLYFVKLV